LEADPEFVEFLMEVGSDFSLTQGLGGNSSIKREGSMLVKASGKRLRDASLPNHFYEVGVSEGEHYEIKSDQAGKPSIEVFLHAMLPQKYIVHLHSTKGVALSMLSARDESLRSELEDRGVSVIDYRTPGIHLKEAIQSKLRSHVVTSQTVTFLLQNHGTLFGANSVVGIREEISRFENAASLRLGFKSIKSLEPENLDTVLDQKAVSHIKWHAQNNWRISPDHVVFLGISAPLGLVQVLTGPTTGHNILQRVFPDLKRIGPREEQLLWFLNVVQLLPQAQLPTLDEGEARTLIQWEAEQHRVKSVQFDL
jgi:ribulose-5-phosphate 4-epimerase/fuculose-1-phosphate aldolase